MKNYLCHVKTKDGKKLEIERQAQNEDSLIRNLVSEDFFIIDIKEVLPGEQKTNLKVSRDNLFLFTKTLAQFLNKDLLLLDAVQAGAKLTSSENLKFLFQKLLDNLTKGISLSKIFSTWYGIPKLYLGLVRVGEQTGNLKEVFSNLEIYLENEKKFKDKWKGALVYPLFVLTIAVVGILSLVFLFFPILGDIVTSINPAAYKNFQQAVNSFFLIPSIISIFGLGILGFILISKIIAKKSLEYRLRWHSFQLFFPILGKRLISNNLVRFSFAMETLLKAGFNMDKALGESIESISNDKLQQELNQIKKKIQQGVTLSSAFHDCSFIPNEMKMWLEIGTASHDYTKAFKNCHVELQDTLDIQNKNLMNLMEPGIILFTGVILILLISQIILPVFQLIGNLT